MYTTATFPLPPLPQGQIDLRALCHSVGRPALTTPAPPAGWRRDVRLLAERPGIDLAGVPPLDVLAAVDGIQARVLLSVRDGRPIYLESVAAAAVGMDPRNVIAFDQRMYVAGSHLDGVYMRALQGGVPVVELDAIDPSLVASEALDLVDHTRRQLEADTAGAALRAGEPIVVDGSIRYLTELTGPLIGVVKDCANTPWLTDESELRSLPEGWRSQAFRIPAQRRSEITVHSCYVRLHDVGAGCFTDGLVRIETTDPDQLDAACAWAFRCRQPAHSTDPRWACHLRAVAHVELVLKGRMELTMVPTGSRPA